MEKWKTEIEAKDGEKNLEDPAGVQHAALGAADRSAQSAGPVYEESIAERYLRHKGCQ